MSATPRLKHFDPGREGEGLTAEEEAFVLARAEARFGAALQVSATAPAFDQIKLDAPRIKAIAAKKALDPQGLLNPGVLIDP